MNKNYIKSSYKALHSIIPCLMLTMSVGMIYAFSLFIPELTTLLSVDRNTVQFAFNLSIFFLGMGAAFFGPLVEKNIKIASWTSTVLFSGGLFVTYLSVILKSVALLYVGIGVLCGIGEGIAYLCPCKNMLLWFSKSRFKGVIMALSIVTFGLGSSLCAQLYGIFYPYVELPGTLLFLFITYSVMMSIGSFFIQKPRYDKFKKMHTNNTLTVSLSKLVKDPYIYSHWMFMFLNISMGLILIGSCASILSSTGMQMATVVFVMSICGISNGVGRIVFPLIGDMLRRKVFVLFIILMTEIVVMFSANIWYTVIPFAIIIINATYGGGFATCPQIVLEKYGSRPLSVVHGILLSAWGFASLFAYLCTYLLSKTSSGYRGVPILLVFIYVVCLIVSKPVWGKGHVEHAN